MGRKEVRFRSRYYAQFLALLEKFGLPKCGRISCTSSLYQNAENLATAKAAELIGPGCMDRRVSSDTQGEPAKITNISGVF
jgi:hypothetical protein